MTSLEEILKKAEVPVNAEKKPCAKKDAAKTAVSSADEEKMISELATTVSELKSLKNNPLKSLILLKRIGNISESMEPSFVPGANSQWDKLYADATAKGKKTVIYEDAVLSSYTKPGSWSYPQSIIDAEAKLKLDKEMAKSTGTAKNTPAKPGPFDKRFSIKA